MKTKPYAHQTKTFDISKDLEYYALWWEMGLGKSKALIDATCHLFLRERIDALLVVAPNGVHGNFASQEMPVHCWDDVPWKAYTYHSGRAGTKRAQNEITQLMNFDGLAVLVMSYDGVKTKLGQETAIKFLTKRKAKMALDESTAIADPDTDRSKKTLGLGVYARYRRVMSGTPVAEGPFKIFNQMRFLNPNFWKNHGLTSFYSFKNTFGLFQTQRAAAGHQYQQLLQYRSLDYLHELIQDCSSRVLKEDALDLPPKVYVKVEFELAPHQRKMYDELLDNMRTEVVDGATIETAMALVRMTRLQQLTSGYAVTEEMPPTAVGDVVMYRTEAAELNGTVIDMIVDIDGVPGCIVSHLSLNPVLAAVGTMDTVVVDRCDRNPDFFRFTSTNQKIINIFGPEFDTHVNPRLDALMTTLEPITHKVIIWARFTRDIEQIIAALTQEYGSGCWVRYDGQVKQRDRELALTEFRQTPAVRFFVANPAAISMGVTLTQAKTVIYYSNSFRLEQRLQSEDRAHRIGQDVSVTIVDLVGRGTVDEHIVETLRTKFDLAATVTGDRYRPWMR